LKETTNEHEQTRRIFFYFSNRQGTKGKEEKTSVFICDIGGKKFA